MAEDMEGAVELVHRGYDAFNRGDFEAAAELLHPDIVWNRAVEVEQPARGSEAAKDLMEPDVFSSQRNEVHGVEVIGDCVLVDVTFHAVGAGSGIELDRRAFHLWRTKDGTAIEFRAFIDREEALAAAGDR
jgi:ketosteroid isomerase-like protein